MDLMRWAGEGPTKAAHCGPQACYCSQGRVGQAQCSSSHAGPREQQCAARCCLPASGAASPTAGQHSKGVGAWWQRRSTGRRLGGAVLPRRWPAHCHQRAQLHGCPRRGGRPPVLPPARPAAPLAASAAAGRGASAHPCALLLAFRLLHQVAAMAKKGIHPEWHSDAKVICNGEEVLTTSGTQGSYTGAFHCSLLLHIAAADDDADDDAVLLLVCWADGSDCLRLLLSMCFLPSQLWAAGRGQSSTQACLPAQTRQ